MNDDIKEIITRINKEIEKHIKDGYSDDMLVIYELDVIQWRILLDYITNLQEENERLKELSYMQHEEYNKLFNHLIIDKPRERINKAIEYMKYNATSNYFDKDKNMFRREIDLLNILQNGSDIQ